METKNITFEDDGEKRTATLEFHASGAEVARFADELAAELNQREVPGFRKGHAPRSMLEQGVGGHDAFYQRVAENLLNELAYRAIDDEDIIFIDQPEFEATSTASSATFR